MSTLRVAGINPRQALAFVTRDDGTVIRVRIRSASRALCDEHGRGPHDLCRHTRALARLHHDTNVEKEMS